jgi:hypothetical protein
MVALTAGILLAGASTAGEYPIAGVSPHERLPGAPVIRSVSKGPEWYQRALTGLEPPYPSSFRFLEDQGNWSTPFNRPGIPGPYDIRGWHEP